MFSSFQFRVAGLGFRFWSFRFRVWSSVLRFLCSMFRVLDFGSRMSRVGFRVWGFGFGGPKEPEEIAQDVFRFRVPCFSFVSRFSVFGFLVLVLFLDFWVPGCQLQVSDFWFRLSGFGSQDFGLGVGPKNQPEEIAEDVFGFRVSGSGF